MAKSSKNVPFKDLCKPDAETKCASDSGVVINRTDTPDVEDALKTVDKNLKKCITKLEEGTNDGVDLYYIGKSFVRERKSVDFNPEDYSTWSCGAGLNSRYRHHQKKDYGRNGTVVLAVVTIPDGSTEEDIKKIEKYTLKLEKKLIKKNKREDDERLYNKTTKPGRGVGHKPVAAFIIYMAFTLEGKCWFNQWTMHMQSFRW